MAEASHGEKEGVLAQLTSLSISPEITSLCDNGFELIIVRMEAVLASIKIAARLDSCLLPVMRQSMKVAVEPSLSNAIVLGASALKRHKRKKTKRRTKRRTKKTNKEEGRGKFSYKH